MDTDSRGGRRLALGCGLMVLVVALCVGGIALGLDGACVASLGPQLPLYPGAEVVSERHNFLRPFGMGETVMILYSPDDAQTVTAWYGRTVGLALRELAQRGGSTLGRGDWSVTQAEDGVGSQIILFGTCAQ